MSRRPVIAATVVAVALALGAFITIRSNQPSGELVLWPFQDPRISTNNNSIRVSPDIPHDPDCYRYSHIDTEIAGDELIVSLFFERIGPEFCIIPCPIGTLEPVSAEIRPKPTTRLTPVPHPDTPPSCWADLR